MDGDGAPTFSVVVPAYQAADFVAGAIRSALEQDPPPLEVIVVDDGSTDDLTSALAPFRDDIIVVPIDHSGAAGAKNAGVERAHGDFVALLDADDRFLAGRLRAMAALATARPDVDVITTDAHIVYQDKRIGRRYGPTHGFAATEQRAAILQHNFVFALAAVRRERFLNVGGFDPAVPYCSDWDLWIRLVFTGSTIGLVPELLAEYHLHDRSMSAQRAATSRGRLLTLTRAAQRTDLSPAEREIVEEARTREASTLARTELREIVMHGAPRDARRAAWRVVASKRQLVRTRAKALGAVVAPRLVARRLVAREQGTFVTVGDWRLPASASDAGSR